MNILYFCNVNRTLPLESGVYKKVVSQCKILRNEGHNIYLASRTGVGYFDIINENGKILVNINISQISRFRRERVLFNELENFCSENNIEAIYSRYSNYNFRVHCFYKRLKKKGICVLLEIPTYPFNQRWMSLRQNIKGRHYIVALKQLYSNTLGTAGALFFKKSVDRIVNNNGFEEIWHIPVLQINNGIDVKSIPVRKHLYQHNKVIKLITVANVANWHGFDRVLLGLYEFYKRERDVKVYFDIVGPGQEIEILTKLTKKYNIEEFVKFRGVLVGKELDAVFDEADLGVAILGIHRNNMKEIDCLKSREFCARKLPFITQSAEKHFRNKSFVYCAPSDETPLNIEEVVDFYYKIIQNPSIFDEMYDFALKYCDWSYTFKSVCDYLKIEYKIIN